MGRAILVLAAVAAAVIAFLPPLETVNPSAYARMQDSAVERFGRTLLNWRAQRDPRLGPKLVDCFLALGQGSNRPSRQEATVFLLDLLRPLAGSSMGEEHAMGLAHGFHEVLHTAFLTDERLEKVLADVRGQLVSLGVARPETDRLVARLRKMGTEMRESGKILDAPMD